MRQLEQIHPQGLKPRSYCRVYVRAEARTLQTDPLPTIQKRGAIAGRLCNLLLTELCSWVNPLARCVSALGKRDRLRSQPDIATFGGI